MQRDEDFIQLIVEAYKSARELFVENAVLQRGRSPSISSLAEELYADYLSVNDASIDTIWIDQAFSYQGKEKKRTFYPDLAIIRKTTIDSLVDLKMDLGWNRDGLLEHCRKLYDRVSEIKGKPATYRDRNTYSGNEVITDKVFSKFLTYSIVIVSAQNGSTKFYEDLQKINVFLPHIRVFVLTDKNHPNDRSKSADEIMSSLLINKKDFDEMRKFLFAN